MLANKIMSKLVDLAGIVVLLLVVLIFYTVGKLFDHEKEKYKKNILLGDYAITKGFIHDVGKIEFSGPYYIEYRYHVNNKEYIRSGASKHASKYYPRCIRSPKECRTTQFWVIYLKDDPRKSLADFSLEIQDIENPQFLENLDKFE
jgi:hypothetical protein